jgi:hypothetical protein
VPLNCHKYRIIVLEVYARVFPEQKVRSHKYRVIVLEVNFVINGKFLKSKKTNFKNNELLK